MDARTLTGYAIIAVMILGLAVLIWRIRNQSPAGRNRRDDIRNRTEERVHQAAMDAQDKPSDPL